MLLLQEAQVHTGMIVALALAGNTEPEVDEHGPLLLIALMGGVAPMRKRLYALKGRPPLFQKTPEGWVAQPLTDEPLHPDVTDGMEGFAEQVRFMPIYTFTPTNAPHNMEFVVYVNGERLKYPSGQRYVYVRTTVDGKILSHNGYEYDFWEQEYALPENAVLVPIGRIEITETPHDPAIIYHGPVVEWVGVMALLSELAVRAGIRITDVHHDHHVGNFLHVGLTGGTEDDRRKFAEYITTNIVVAKGLFSAHCPHCWKTVAREHSL